MKYVLTEEIVEALEKLDGELSDAMVLVCDICNSDEIYDADIDDLNYVMKCVIDAWEALRRTPKEKPTNEQTKTN